MKKLFKNSKFLNIFIISINVLFVGGLVFGEGQYIHSSRMTTIEANKDGFISANKSLSSMTSNYLVGESHLCRSWANHLNYEKLTMDEAIEFVKSSITDKDVMAHIVYSGTKKGKSTQGNASNPDNKEVDYDGYFLSKVTYQENSGIKASPQYTNPINAKASIAFYTEIKLKNESNPSLEDEAFLLRVVPISNLEAKWTFPSSFKHLDVAIIDNSSSGSTLGAYIFHHSAFRGTTFYEYYSSYNYPSESALKDLQVKMASNEGVITMKDSYGKELFVSYSQIPDPEQHTKWTIITAIPMMDITKVETDWLTISIIGFGLGILFIIDLVILLLLNKGLQDSAKVAESANKAKTDFLSTMSHDIRTPMNAIVGLTYIANKQDSNPEVTQDALKKIDLASNHLLTLINDILDISKVESGKLTINPLSFSIVDTFENLINISQPMVKSKNIDFNFITHGFNHEWLYADKLRLSQIFTNLLSNALKYTQDNGKVTVDVSQLPSDKEGYIKLIYQVADTGIGMSKEYLEKLYEPFSRATDSRINTIQGTGLGLAIAKQMVDLMNGTIECESEVGVGTTFTVSIDLAIDEASHEDLTLPPINVLVVNNNESQLENALETINSMGAKAISATSGKQAFDIIKDNKEPFKVIILDWQMEDMDALEITKDIKEMKLEENPIILVSAYEWSEIEKQAKDAGVNGFILKPLFRSKLYQKINDLLNHDKSKTINEEDEMNFPGIKVLIVEDNDINWEIISTLLSMHEISCDRAENGKVALDLITQYEYEHPYDLIFMDIQMPVMNGLEATKAIRRLDSEYARSVPIIAMSADAFSENVTECLQAGMNGHIAKPIDLKLVLNEIRKINKK